MKKNIAKSFLNDLQINVSRISLCLRNKQTSDSDCAGLKPGSCVKVL